jgi:hypothetical protein
LNKNAKRNGVLGLFGLWWEEEKIGNGVIGGSAVGGGGAEVPAVSGGGDGKVFWVGAFWMLGSLGEERTRRRWGMAVRRGENGEGNEKKMT